MKNLKKNFKEGIAAMLLVEGIEEGIKKALDIHKNIKAEGEEHYIKLEGNEEGKYHNEIAFATSRLEIICNILSFKPLREEREHIKTLCDEIRTIADDLEKLI